MSGLNFTTLVTACDFKKTRIYKLKNTSKKTVHWIGAWLDEIFSVVAQEEEKVFFFKFFLLMFEFQISQSIILYLSLSFYLFINLFIYLSFYLSLPRSVSLSPVLSLTLTLYHPLSLGD